MNKYCLKLTDNEKAILALINLKESHHNHEEAHAAFKANKKPILSLLKSLNDREAIPQERLNYWTDPRYNTGRGKMSHKEVFESNSCTGQDIYTHPNFIPYLNYFLFGPNLTDEVISKFEAQVGNPEWVTSGDIGPICTYARNLTRQYHLDVLSAPEEFFKLCLDMGLGPDTAKSVRGSVMKTR